MDIIYAKKKVFTYPSGITISVLELFLYQFFVKAI